MRKTLCALALLSAITLGGCASNGMPWCPCGRAARQSEPVLRHVVLFQFNDHLTAEEIQEVEEAFAALADKIDEIHDFEWGTDVSVEGLNDGFTHCFVVTFQSEADRDAYLPHPDHEAFVALLSDNNRLARALVVDYWTQQP